MEPSRDLLSAVAVAVILLVYSWVFDDRPALFAGTSLLLFLAFIRIAVLSDIRATISTLSARREVGRDTVRQGMPVSVVTRLAATLPGGLSLQVHEVLPGGCGVREGSAVADLSGEGPLDREIRYRAVLYSIGPVRFRGLSLSFSHMLFADSFTLTRDDAGGPTIYVEPVSAFERRTPGLLDEESGGKEHRAVLLGSGIRSFRQYTAGDDPRHIDWKLSAKYGHLYVREFVGITGRPPLLVLDLPEGEGGEYPPGTDRLIGGIGEALGASFSEYQRFSLLIISGSSVVKFIPAGTDPFRTRREISALRPVPLSNGFYRALDRTGARSAAGRAHLLERATGGGSTGSLFATRLASWYEEVSEQIADSAYDGMLVRVFAILEPREVNCYTLLSGDLTHIRRLIVRGRRAGSAVFGYIPRDTMTSEHVRRLAGLGFDGVEAVR